MNRTQRTGDVGELNGVRALVTGSSRGIGRAMVEEFARAGADVVLHANRSFSRARELAGELCAGGTRAVALCADLRDPDARRRLAAEAFEALGGLDVWVNNAGVDILVAPDRKRPFEERLTELLDVDVRATIVLTRLAGSRLRDAGGGSIINLGWDKALTGMEGESGELYAAAKAAVAGFTKSAALSLAPTVRVNCIAPGWIQTGWGEQAGPEWSERVHGETPLERWGQPADVAAVARFLASDRSRFITGQVICVNGGSVR